MKTSDVLFRAGGVLRERGWRTGAEGNSPHIEGRVCILGAINIVRGWGGPYETESLPELRKVTESETLWAWNDTRGRTVDEVLVAMDAAYVLALQIEGIEPEDVL